MGVCFFCGEREREGEGGEREKQRKGQSKEREKTKREVSSFSLSLFRPLSLCSLSLCSLSICLSSYSISLTMRSNGIFQKSREQRRRRKTAACRSLFLSLEKAEKRNSEKRDEKFSSFLVLFFLCFANNLSRSLVSFFTLFYALVSLFSLTLMIFLSLSEVAGGEVLNCAEVLVCVFSLSLSLSLSLFSLHSCRVFVPLSYSLARSLARSLSLFSLQRIFY